MPEILQTLFSGHGVYIEDRPATDQRPTDRPTPTHLPTDRFSHLANIGETSNGHISARGRPIHFMFGSTVGFSGSVDRMALTLGNRAMQRRSQCHSQVVAKRHANTGKPRDAASVTMSKVKV